MDSIHDLESLSPELVTQILLNLSVTEISRVCRVSSYLRSFCSDWQFWAEKAAQDFNYPITLFLQHQHLPAMRGPWGVGPSPIKAYQDIQKRQQDLDHSLIFFAQRGNLPEINYLLHRGATNLNGALRVAASSGQMTTVDELILAGATDISGAVIEAARHNHKALMDYLIDLGDAMNHPIDLNQALDQAAYYGRLNIVRDLINRGATNINEALRHAIGSAVTRPLLFRYLLSVGANPDPLDRALIRAADNGNHVRVKFFLDSGAITFTQAAAAATESGYPHIANLIREYRRHPPSIL
jgi:ankyrin repeat protein